MIGGSGIEPLLFVIFAFLAAIQLRGIAVHPSARLNRACGFVAPFSAGLRSNQ